MHPAVLNVAVSAEFFGEIYKFLRLRTLLIVDSSLELGIFPRSFLPSLPDRYAWCSS